MRRINIYTWACLFLSCTVLPFTILKAVPGHGKSAQKQHMDVASTIHPSPETESVCVCMS